MFSEQPEALERLEYQILEQESEISNVENRACFALHCIQMETQLVYANMEVLASALQKMAEYERIAHSEVSSAAALQMLFCVFHFFVLAFFSA